MKTKITATLTVFYAWQSDLSEKTNRYAIRTALSAAASALSTKHGIQIVIDEATRGEVGSINIPSTILKKIRGSDIFVCDITTINGGDLKPTRRTPNPNVAFELGYAVAYLGWERIIMLFNEAHGSLKEAPFDFDRHRISAYRYHVDANGAKQSASSLRSLCEVALEAIFQKNPPKEYDLRDLSPSDIKRKKDVENLRWALSWIHWPTITDHLVRAPKYVNDSVLFYWEEFDAVVTNPLFHLYDKKLDKLIRELHESWSITRSFDQHYIDRGDGRIHIFHMPGDVFRYPEQENDWKMIEAGLQRMAKVIPKLLAYVRRAYLEIAIEDTNRAAFEAHRRHRRAIEKEFRSSKTRPKKAKTRK